VPHARAPCRARFTQLRLHGNFQPALAARCSLFSKPTLPSLRVRPNLRAACRRGRGLAGRVGQVVWVQHFSA